MKKIILMMSLLLLFVACSKYKLTDEMPASRKMEIAKEYFEDGKYNKAIPFLQQIAFERSSAYTAEAQMLLADSYFAQNKFTEARFEYQELIRLFKDYSRIGEAYFQIGVCYYEESLAAHYTQEETQLAIDAFETFINRFPFSQQKQEAIDYISQLNYKLLEKKYLNGYAYYKMFDYSAALLYFDEVIELGNKNELDRLSLYYAARIYAERENLEELNRIYQRLLTRYPESEETAKIAKLLE
ncbi:MAG: outer membrane protein assembly factor BamD [Candidatus Cloacimonadales bacterium]